MYDTFSHNGTLYSKNSPIFPIDSAILYGYGCFETMKVEKGEILYFFDHLCRLRKCLDTLMIPSINNQKLLEEAITLLSLLKVQDAVLRLTVTENDRFFTLRDIPYTSTHYQNGFKLCISEVKRNSTSLLSRHKTCNYLENLLALKKAKKEGFDEVLFLNEKSFFCEGASSNLFFFNEEMLFTPHEKCGLLEGTMRTRVINRAQEKGFKVVEGEFTLFDLLHAEGAFLTNAVMGIMPIFSIKQHTFKNFDKTLSLKAHLSDSL